MSTFIDLFCGCGGFSLGMMRAGFRCLAAIDFNPEAIATFKKNFPTVRHALEEDLTKYPPEELARLLGETPVDVVVGGPPCQGFSNVRQVDWANHGSRVKRDKRRYYYRVFLEYVRHFQPRVFVMENVLGIQSAVKGKIFTLVQSEARLLRYRVHPQVEEAWMLGVPQKRRRQLIIGVREDVPGYFPSDLRPAPRAFAAGMIPARGTRSSQRHGAPLRPPGCPTLWDAIGDLPPLIAGQGDQESDYNNDLRENHLVQRGERARNYLENVLEVGRLHRLTAHQARPQNDKDLRDFQVLREGEHSGQAEARGAKMEFTYNRTCFHDRYKRQHREDLCSTIVAHLSKDGLMFIHPTQNRSLTPREAARVQSFPDWFVWPPARTHQFRLIGNAVPPLVGEAVGLEIRGFLDPTRTDNLEQIELPLGMPENPSRREPPQLPASRVDASFALMELARKTRQDLRLLPTDNFLRGWNALLFLFPELHPDNALDHGAEKFESGGFLEGEMGRRYARSGWPVVLEPLGVEAWRRYRAKEFTSTEFYCVAAQHAGLRHRRELLEPLAEAV